MERRSPIYLVSFYPPSQFTAMVRRKSQKASENELQMQMALAGMSDGTYMTIDQAVKGVPRTTLYRRWNSRKSRTEAKENAQLLTRQEERALAQWISTSTATGNPVRHSFILEMAEKIRQPRVAAQPGFTR